MILLVKCDMQSTAGLPYVYPWIASSVEVFSIKEALEVSSGIGGWRLEKKKVLSTSRRIISFQKNSLHKLATSIRKIRL